MKKYKNLETIKIFRNVNPFYEESHKIDRRNWLCASYYHDENGYIGTHREFHSIMALEYMRSDVNKYGKMTSDGKVLVIDMR